MGLFTALLSTAGVTVPRAGIGGPRSIPFVVASVVVYFATILAIGVAARIYLTQRVLKLIISALELHNLDAAANVAARASTANALGEGFADSLDVVGF